jgi:hypothetical protein
MSAAKGQAWSVERWVSIVAVVVSFCALGLAFYSGHQTRLHNRLSVQPRLTIDFVYTLEGAGFKLVNEGLGPAIIGTFVVSVDEKPRRTWDAAAEALGVKPVTTLWRIPYPDTAWLVGDPQPRVYWIPKSPASDLLIKQSPRVSISVCYCSMYGECWLKTRNAGPPEEMGSCEATKDQLVNNLP